MEIATSHRHNDVAGWLRSQVTRRDKKKYINLMHETKYISIGNAMPYPLEALSCYKIPSKLRKLLKNKILYKININAEHVK
jgi:hypothetical protein